MSKEGFYEVILFVKGETYYKAIYPDHGGIRWMSPEYGVDVTYFPPTEDEDEESE